MTDPPRMHRPEPERTGPIRNFGTIFGAPPTHGAMPPMGPFGPMGPMGPFGPPMGAPGPGAAVSQGVQMGYRVIEEYLRQGQNAARMMYGPWVGAGQGAPWTQPPWSSPAGGGAQGAPPFLGPWADLMQAMLGAFPGFWAPPPGEVHGAAGPFTAGGHAQGTVPIVTPPPRAPDATPHAHVAPTPRAGLRTAVVVDVAPECHAEVIVELLGGAVEGELVVHSLRTPEGSGHKISGVKAEFVAADELVRVTVKVTAAAPPGTYSGLIIDRGSGLPRGTVTARVLARP